MLRYFASQTTLNPWWMSMKLPVTTITSTTSVLPFSQSQPPLCQIPPSVKHKLPGGSPPSNKHKLPRCSPSTKHKLPGCSPPSIKQKLPVCSPTSISTTSVLRLSPEIITPKGIFSLLRSSKSLRSFSLSLDKICYSKAKIYLQIFLTAVSIVPG